MDDDDDDGGGGDGEHGAVRSGRQFGMDLLGDLGAMFTTSAGTMPTAAMAVLLLFANERLLGVSRAKLMFVIGYFVSALIFYAVSSVCFPAADQGLDLDLDLGQDQDQDQGQGQGLEDGQGYDSKYALMTHSTQRMLRSLMPFTRATSASFYCFSIGYLFGYWTNLNMAKQTPNAMMNAMVYLTAAFVLVLFNVFVVQEAQWRSAIVSVCTGLIFGMIWSQVSAGQIATDRADGQEAGPAPSSTGATACDANSKDMVCNVFRA
jgi:hypothetical protein